MKEVDSLGIGQFSNILQNAALCIAIISKVHNGAVAVGRRERLLCNGSSSTLFRTKKDTALRCLFFWWEEVDSFNSGTGKFTCISGASAPKQVVQAQCAARCKPRRIHDSRHKKRHRIAMSFFLVGRGGFEPPKAVPTDLQSAPFGHSGIFPRLELVVGVEPTTC